MILQCIEVYSSYHYFPVYNVFITIYVNTWSIVVATPPERLIDREAKRQKVARCRRTGNMTSRQYENNSYNYKK